MKKMALAATFGVALLMAIPAHAGNRDSDGRWGHGRDRKSFDVVTAPTSVPEPSSILMLASGLVALGGAGFLGRRKAN